MVEFDIRRKSQETIEIGNLYVIYGNDMDGEARLLIVGGNEAITGTDVPVIDVTAGSHLSRYYSGDTNATDVCKDFEINPQTAQYIDDYDVFTLTFQCNEEG